LELDERIAIVTGGSAGIGGAIAQRLVAHGATVVVADVDAPVESNVRFVRTDVGVPDDVRRLFAFVVEELGRLDVLVNNAGGVFETWQRTVDVNFNGLVIATQLAFEAMRGDGAIVSVSSVAGLGTTAYSHPDYAASKAAVVRFTTALANHDGVRVNCICPDWVDTPAVRRSLAEMTEEERAEVPRLVPVDEIAAVVIDLVRDDSAAGRVVVRWAHEPGPRVLANQPA
jgi:NAD(P)-dependent dehydrogenase (short-subunit alcohol dehydrogenase family)